MISGARATVTVAEPDLVVSCVEVAVIVAAPAAAGVKMPALLTVPIVEGLTDHVTDVLKLPVPVTVGVQVTVCVVRMDTGAQTTETKVIVGGAATVTVVLPDAARSCVEVAVMVAVPGDAGVKTPDGVIEPPVTPQVNAGLNAPVPCTVAVHWEVWLDWMVEGLQDTETDVMVELGGGGVVPPPPPPQPNVKPVSAPRRRSASESLKRKISLPE